MKRLILFLLLGCLLLCACAQGEPISSEYFGRVMAEKGFSVEDHTKYLDQSRSWYLGEGEEIKAWGSYFVCFDKYRDEESAKDTLAEQKKYYDAMGEATDECKRVFSSDSYMYYEYTDYDKTDMVFIAARNENTVISVYANVEFAEAAEDLLEEFGYGK